jgi:peptide methionine sulfoxide reductase MsrA
LRENFEQTIFTFTSVIIGMNESEKKVVTIMIHMYCRSKHGNKNTLCYECEELKNYAQSRLEHCPYGDNKPTCNTCPIHCYRRDMKVRIKEVMRFSGPRMLFVHPIETLKHFRKEYKRKRLFSRK